MLSIKQQKIKAHCNTFHNILFNFFEATPFDAVGYVYYDNNGNYFSIQSDERLYDKLVDSHVQKQIISSYYTNKPQTIYTENLEHSDDNILFEIIGSLEYKSVIHIAFFKQDKVEIISFYSKTSYQLVVDYFINNLGRIEKIVSYIQRRISSLANEKNFVQVLLDFNHIQQDMFTAGQSFDDVAADENLFLSTQELPLNMEQYQLKNDEKEIIILIYYGFTLSEIAEKLEVSRRTVDRRLNAIRGKLNCKCNLNIIPILLKKH